MRKLALLSVAAALALPLLASPTLAASKQTAEVSGAGYLYSGPGSVYPRIGRIPNGARVHLIECTPNSWWCKVDNPDGRDGWIYGPNLVGWSAKIEVTPFSFTFDPFDRDDDRHDRTRPF